MWRSCGRGRRDCWEHTKRARKPKCVFCVVSGFKHHKFNENATGRTNKFGGRREVNARNVGRSGESVQERADQGGRCRRGRSKGKRMARRGGKGKEELRAKEISNHFCKLIKQRKGHLRKLSGSYEQCKFQFRRVIYKSCSAPPKGRKLLVKVCGNLGKFKK